MVKTIKGGGGVVVKPEVIVAERDDDDEDASPMVSSPPKSKTVAVKKKPGSEKNGKADSIPETPDDKKKDVKGKVSDERGWRRMTVLSDLSDGNYSHR
jgi:hypothetical protein